MNYDQGSFPHSQGASSHSQGASTFVKQLVAGTQELRTIERLNNKPSYIFYLLYLLFATWNGSIEKIRRKHVLGLYKTIFSIFKLFGKDNNN